MEDFVLPGVLIAEDSLPGEADGSSEQRLHRWDRRLIVVYVIAFSF